MTEFETSPLKPKPGLNGPPSFFYCSVSKTFHVSCYGAHGVVFASMQGETKERWLRLCEQAAIEQDPKKLLELVKEIDELLAKKQERLDHRPPDPKPST